MKYKFALLALSKLIHKWICLKDFFKFPELRKDKVLCELYKNLSSSSKFNYIKLEGPMVIIYNFEQ